MSSILYLHGFHSSPYSEKTVIFRNYLQQQHPEIELIAPQLPCKPKQAKEFIQQLLEQYNFSGAVGSSLGGYLATYLHNQVGLPAVLINPAVKPFELLHEYVGRQVHPVTGEEYLLTEQDMLELKALYQADIKDKDRVWLLQQELDEVLDYRQALAHYQGCKINFELGGNHAFVGFDRYPEQIIKFFNLV